MPQSKPGFFKRIFGKDEPVQQVQPQAQILYKAEQEKPHKHAPEKPHHEKPKKKGLVGRVADSIGSFFGRDKMEASAYAFGCNDDGTLREDGTPNFGTTATSSQIPASEKEYTIATKDGMPNGTIYKLTNRSYSLPDGSHPSSIYIKTDTAGRNKIDIYAGVGTEALALHPEITNGKVKAISNKGDKTGADVYLNVEILGKVDLKNAEAFKQSRALTHKINHGKEDIGALAEVPTFTAGKDFQHNKSLALNAYSDSKRAEMLANIKIQKLENVNRMVENMTDAAFGRGTQVPLRNDIPSPLLAAAGKKENIFDYKIPHSLEAKQPTAPEAVIAAVPAVTADKKAIIAANEPKLGPVVASKPEDFKKQLELITQNSQSVKNLTDSMLAAAKLGNEGAKIPLKQSERQQLFIADSVQKQSERPLLGVPDSIPKQSDRIKVEPQIEIRSARPVAYSSNGMAIDYLDSIEHLNKTLSRENVGNRKTPETESVHMFLERHLAFQIKESEKGFYGPKTTEAIKRLQEFAKTNGGFDVDINGNVDAKTREIIVKAGEGKFDITQLREQEKVRGKLSAVENAAELLHKNGAVVSTQSIPTGTEVVCNVTSRAAVQQNEEQMLG